MLKNRVKTFVICLKNFKKKYTVFEHFVTSLENISTSRTQQFFS